MPPTQGKGQNSPVCPHPILALGRGHPGMFPPLGPVLLESAHHSAFNDPGIVSTAVLFYNSEKPRTAWRQVLPHHYFIKFCVLELLLTAKKPDPVVVPDKPCQDRAGFALLLPTNSEAGAQVTLVEPDSSLCSKLHHQLPSRFIWALRDPPNNDIVPPLLLFHINKFVSMALQMPSY